VELINSFLSFFQSVSEPSLAIELAKKVFASAVPAPEDLGARALNVISETKGLLSPADAQQVDRFLEEHIKSWKKALDVTRSMIAKGKIAPALELLLKYIALPAETGVGLLKINKNTESGKKRLLARAEGPEVISRPNASKPHHSVGR
jgi:hypothetical protein